MSGAAGSYGRQITKEKGSHLGSPFYYRPGLLLSGDAERIRDRQIVRDDAEFIEYLRRERQMNAILSRRAVEVEVARLCHWDDDRNGDALSR